MSLPPCLANGPTLSRGPGGLVGGVGQRMRQLHLMQPVPAPGCRVGPGEPLHLRPGRGEALLDDLVAPGHAVASQGRAGLFHRLEQQLRVGAADHARRRRPAAARPSGPGRGDATTRSRTAPPPPSRRSRRRSSPAAAGPPSGRRRRPRSPRAAPPAGAAPGSRAGRSAAASSPRCSPWAAIAASRRCAASAPSPATRSRACARAYG